MKGITKRFGDLIANHQIDFDLKQGEIHALLGENGAGKTTLMRILYGLYHADEGSIYIEGKLAHITSPRQAIQLGIGMVTQHFTLVPTLTVTENLTLGEKGFLVNVSEMEMEVAKASERFGIPVKPSALVRHLSVGERQRVEILKALYRNARILILDEPTAVLVPQEVEALFEALERLRKSGLSVIFISHKLNEVMTVCDRISVLRDGQHVGTVEKDSTTQTELARMMVGRETFGITRQGEQKPGRPLLQVQNLNVLDRKGLPALKDVSFEVHGGEILGIAGVSGNGQSELSQTLSGMIKPTSGKILVDGVDLSKADPAQMAAAQVGCIPEDRHAGLVSELNVAENIALMHLEALSSRGVINQIQMKSFAQQLIDEYQIKASPRDRTRTLSGGNMQKVILARTLSRHPKVIVVSQPTRGLDVGATEYVRSKLLEQRERGAAVLLISEDLDEVLALSDRIAVIYEGQITGILPASQATPERLGLMMSGSIKEVTSG
ncbi:MAG: ABC transporter ATP-binding protein [Anaerolineae bacterium]|nr:ABC transporter ATP-binding protein [Anaerolineae bacterium]